MGAKIRMRVAVFRNAARVSANTREPAMKPSAALNDKRDLVRAAATRFRAANVRVFGSVQRGAARDDSDLVILVDPMPGATLFDLGGLQVELEDLLGVPVDLRTPGDLPASFRDRVLADAKLL